MSSIISSIVEAYQALVQKELIEKLKPAGWNFENPSTYLSDADLEFCSQFVPDLVSRGLLIRYSNGYRTAHGDLLYRLTKIRYFRNQNPIPLERDISVTEEPVPDFGTCGLTDLLKRLNIDESEALLIEQALKAGNPNFKGLSTYQAHYIEHILRGAHKYFGVVAPTASGKSLIFFIPVLLKALQRLREGKTGVSSIVMYPRKALANDQIQRVLQAIDFINQQVGNKLTIAIDDGDTWRMWRELRNNDCVEFRGLVCPRTEREEAVCGHKLLLYNNGIIRCEGGHSLDYIITNRQDIVKHKPLILVTNIWRVYRMMLEKGGVNLLQNLDIIAMDESHVYTGYKGAHIAMVIRLLRYLSSRERQNTNTTFIFSSATISNPRQFISNLAGISEEELFYQDYRDLTPSTGKKRLLIYVYLLPAPYGGSAETLAEAIMEAVGLWCHKHALKAIAFADSVSTVTTFQSYFYDTILSPKREGREIIDHVFDDNGNPLNNPDDDYSWYTLTPLTCTDRDSLRRFLLNDFKKSIDIHYGSLRPSERANRELKLKQGLTRLMIATSTLELGIDLSDIAAIVQYKLPITPEAVSQRVGRGGRVDSCYRISMGVVILPSNPLGTIYMYNRKLREKLEKVEALPPLRIGERSENLILMHALTMLLLMRNLNSKDTFLTIRSVDEAVRACRELKLDIPQVLEFNRTIGLFDEQLLKKALEKLEKALEFTTDELGEEMIDIENAVQILERVQSCCFDSWTYVSEILQRWPNGLGPPHHLLKELKSRFGRLQAELKWVIETLRNAAVRRELPSVFRIEEDLQQLPDPDEALNKLLTWLGSLDYRKYGLPREMFLNKISMLIGSLRKLREQLLPQAASILQKLAARSIDIRAVVNRSLRRRIEEEIRAGREAGRTGIDIFKLMEILMGGHHSFSPLFDQPLPKLRVEERYA